MDTPENPQPEVETIRVADFDAPSAIDALAPPPDPAIAAADVFMSKDDFAKLLYGGHAATALGIQMAKGPRIDTLLRSREVDGFREASDALYDCCADLPWMHWVLQQSGKWAMRAGMVGMYAINLGKAVGEEIEAKRAAAAKPANPQPAAQPETTTDMQ